MADQPHNLAGINGNQKSDAADVIRAKLDRLYKTEPDAREELAETYGLPEPTSKHQRFMYELSQSGKDLATIQTDWHNYYSGLPAQEKQEVWQEFYDSQPLITSQPKATEVQALAKHKTETAKPSRTRPVKPEAGKKAALQSKIRSKVKAGGKITLKQHLQSLAFGLGMGSFVVFIFLFGFFNQVFIAPFIQPSRASASTPIILSTDSVAPTPNPEVIIPKINVEIPVNYSEQSTDEASIESDLQDGVVHYPTTVLPGQTGNAAFFGHSSNNIFNPGKYKFAFVLLHTMVPGDTFYLTYNQKVFVYKVISTTIVDPSDIGVLGPVSGQTATATLITCDPPGTSIHRLIVVGTQISPDPSGNTAAAATPANQTPIPPNLPSTNGPSLWGHFIGTIWGKTIIFVIGLVAVVWIRRKASQWRKPVPA